MAEQNEVFFFFPSSNFYFLQQVGVQSGTPAPAPEGAAPFYSLVEMITGTLYLFHTLNYELGTLVTAF